MKSVTSLTFGLLASFAMANPNYVNTVRQIQQDTGVEWDVTVAPLGVMISPEGVGPTGSNFELWTLNALTAQSTFLDSEFVSAFTPSGEIEIVTGDPYPHAVRTRADMPFTVTLNVNGLMSDEEAPASAREVEFEHVLYHFPEGEHTIDREEAQGLIYEAHPISSNGSLAKPFDRSNLNGSDLRYVEGEEVFSIYSVGDETFPAELLDQEVVTVWPMAQAEILGVVSGNEYASIPPLTIQLVDLYPDSTTFVRVYQGEVSTNPENPVEINDSDLVIYDVVPQDRTITLTDLGNVMQGGGVWTVEVIHKTPWGYESLKHVSPDLGDNALQVRAGLFTK